MTESECKHFYDFYVQPCVCTERPVLMSDNVPFFSVVLFITFPPQFNVYKTILLILEFIFLQ